MVADPVWLHFVAAENLADRTLNDARQAGISCHHGMLTGVSAPAVASSKGRADIPGPWPSGGQRHQPSRGVFRELRRFARPRAVVEYRHRTKPHRAMQALLQRLMGSASCFTHRVGRRIGAIGQQDLRCGGIRLRVGCGMRLHRGARRTAPTARRPSHGEIGGRSAAVSGEGRGKRPGSPRGGGRGAMVSPDGLEPSAPRLKALCAASG